MFLVALLVGLCMPAVLRAAVIDEGDLEGKVFYIRNVATGLYLKQGGTWGTHAVEGRAAHPFALEAWGADVYAISSINGYLNSTVSNQSDVRGFFMESTSINDSKWKLVRANTTTDYYYIESNGRRFASQSHASGQIGLVAPDANDARQQWQILTKSEIVPAEIAVAQGAEPVSIDVTALIDGSSFDLVDGVESKIKYPLHGAITGFATNVEYRNVAWATTTGESGENGVWMRTECWDVRDSDPMVYNSAFITRNNVHSAFTVSQTLDYALPAGNYTFSFEGFYARRHSGGGDENMNVSMKIKVGTEEKIVYFSKNQDITISSFIDGKTKMTLNGVEYNRENYAAALFRDNDDYIQTIAFTVPAGGSVITIEISKPKTNETGGWDWIIGDQTWQNMIACDNLTLTYHGNPVSTTDTDPAILYYDRVRAAYLHATTELYKLAGNSYDDACATVSGCVHWTKWDAAISGVVTVEGITKVRGQNPTEPDPAKKFAYLNGKNNKIDTEKEFLEALAKIEEAYQAALAEHNGHLSDFTGKILNHSFETGDLTSWTVVHTDGDIAVWPNSNGTYTTAGVDGDYLFNSYSWPDENTNAPGIMQEVTGLDNGLYELKALVTSFGPGERSFIPADGPGNTVYIFANGYHTGIEAKSLSTFEEAILYFLVEDGKATIGAVGGNNGTRLGVYPFKYYFPHVGCFFKADNFRLTRICDVPNGKLKLALDEASEANLAFDEFGKASVAEVLAEYKSIYDNRIATADNVDGYITEIHTALNTAAKQQQMIGADMTYAIKNPNFEWSWVDGEWNHTPGEDSGIRQQEQLNWWGGFAYRTVGVDGRHLFNTWKNNTKTLSVTGCRQDRWWESSVYKVDVAFESAEPLTQSLTDLPNGTYKLEAMLVSHPGETMVLTANDVSTERTITYANDNGEFVSVECEVTDGTLDIQVAGKQVTKTVTIPYYKNQNKKVVSATSEQSYSYTPWFKADNFRLTMLKPQLLILDEKATVTPKIEGLQFEKVRVNRTVKSNSNWSTFVLPFEVNLTADNWLKTSGCIVKELKSVVVDGEHVRLTFGTPQTTIAAGRPCIIKNPSAATLEYIEVEKVNVDTQYDDENAQTVYYEDENGLMRFHGVYHRRAIPQDAFFISNNNFYKAVGPKHQNPDMISGFRGYFEILNTAGEQGARAFSFRIGEDETAVEDVNNGPATVVAIYNLSGIRLDGMQDGVNILQMSDGTSIKVVIE